MITIYNILKETGLISKEIKQRYVNKQIKINGKPVKNLDRLLNVTFFVEEAGEWFSNKDNNFVHKISILRLFFDSLGDMFELKTNIKSKDLDYLKGYLLLETGKRNKFILTKDTNGRKTNIQTSQILQRTLGT